MCGRLSCCCAPDIYRKALSHFDATKNEFIPIEWKDMPGYTFESNATILPGDVVPVIMLSNRSELKLPVLQPMVWGFQPSWGNLKAQVAEKSYSTHNCRIEGVRESKLYSPCLKSGRRCVVFCEGYYEGAPGSKQVFIHHTDNDEFHAQQVSYWERDDVWNEKEGWKGPKLVKMAGIYNIMKEGDKDVYTFTILTRESVGQLASVHHRMPAILTNDEELKDWLDSGRVPSDAAVDNLTHLTNFDVNIKTIPRSSKTVNKKLPVQKNTLMNWVIRKKNT